MYEEVLEQIGLTKQEALVYETLLNKGSLTATQLDKKTPGKIKRSNVYNILDSLIKKGLVEFKKTKKTTLFIAESPDNLLNLIDKKEEEIAKIKNEAQVALPQLKSLFDFASKRPGVRIFSGEEGIKKIYLDTLTSETPIYALLSISPVKPSIYQWLIQTYVKKRVQQKIKAYVIATNEKRNIVYKKHDEQFLRETHLIPKKKMPFSMEIDIYDSNKVAFISYKEDELIGIIIESKNVYQTMRAIFETIW